MWSSASCLWIFHSFPSFLPCYEAKEAFGWGLVLICTWVWSQSSGSCRLGSTQSHQHELGKELHLRLDPFPPLCSLKLISIWLKMQKYILPNWTQFSHLAADQLQSKVKNKVQRCCEERANSVSNMRLAETHSGVFIKAVDYRGVENMRELFGCENPANMIRGAVQHHGHLFRGLECKAF